MEDEQVLQSPLKQVETSTAGPIETDPGKGNQIELKQVDNGITAPTEPLSGSYVSGVDVSSFSDTDHVQLPAEGGIRELEKQRADNQKWYQYMGKGFLTMGTRFAAEVTKMLPALAIGAGETVDKVFGSNITDGDSYAKSFEDNAFLNYVDELADSVQEALPLYERDRNKYGGFVRTTLLNPHFYATQGADAIGFAASFLTPGVAIKALNVGTGASKLLNKGISLTGKGNKLGMLKTAKALGMKGEQIDLALATGMSTFFEAQSESRETMKHLRQELEAEGMLSPEEIDAKVAEVGRNIFVANSAILLGPNMLTNKIILGKFKGAPVNKFTKTGKGLDAAIEYKALTGAKKYAKIASDFGLGVFSETFEEVSQSTADSFFSEKAIAGEEAGQMDLLTNLVEEYTKTLGTTEGQQAAYLGALMGGIMGGAGAYRGAKNAKKRDDLLISRMNDNMRVFSANIAAPFKKENGKVVYDKITNRPILEDEQVVEAIRAKVGMKSIADLLTLSAADSDVTLYNEILNYALTDLAIPYTQMEGGMEILESQIAGVFDIFAESNKSLQSPANPQGIPKEQFVAEVSEKVKAIKDYSDVYSNFVQYNLSDLEKGELTEGQFQDFSGFSAIKFISGLSSINHSKKEIERERQAHAKFLMYNDIDEDQVIGLLNRKVKYHEDIIKKNKKSIENFYSKEGVAKEFKKYKSNIAKGKKERTEGEKLLKKAKEEAERRRKIAEATDKVTKEKVEVEAELTAEEEIAARKRAIAKEAKKRAGIPKAPPVKKQTAFESIDDGKLYNYEGKEGTITTEGQQIIFESGDNIVELGNIEEVRDTPLEEFGLEKQKELSVILNDDNSIEVEGKRYINNYSTDTPDITRTKDGGYTVTLDTENGQKRTFRGRSAEAIVYQYKLKEYEKNGTNKSDEQGIAEVETEVERIQEEASESPSKKKDRRAKKTRRKQQRTLKTFTAPKSKKEIEEEKEKKKKAEKWVQQELQFPEDPDPINKKTEKEKKEDSKDLFTDQDPVAEEVIEEVIEEAVYDDDFLDVGDDLSTFIPDEKGEIEEEDPDQEPSVAGTTNEEADAKFIKAKNDKVSKVIGAKRDIHLTKQYPNVTPEYIAYLRTFGPKKGSVSFYIDEGRFNYTNENKDDVDRILNKGTEATEEEFNFLVNTIPFNVDINGISAPLSVAGTEKDRVLISKIIYAMLHGTSLSDIHTTIAYQMSGKANAKEGARNNILDLEYIDGDINKVSLNKVNKKGILTDKDNKIVGRRTGRRSGSVYLRAEQYNGDEIFINLNTRGVSEAEADILVDLFEQVMLGNNSISKMSQAFQNKISTILSNELRVIDKNINEVTVDELINFLIFVGKTSSLRNYIGILPGRKGNFLIFGKDQFKTMLSPTDKNKIREFILDRKNRKVSFHGPGTSNVSNRNYVRHLVEDEILTTNFRTKDANGVQFPMFNGDVNIYLDNANVTASGKKIELKTREAIKSDATNPEVSKIVTKTRPSGRVRPSERTKPTLKDLKDKLKESKKSPLVEDAEDKSETKCKE